MDGTLFIVVLVFIIFQVCIACITPKYVVSHHCNRELNLADTLTKPIIPVMYGRVMWPPPGGMSLILSPLVYIDMKGLYNIVNLLSLKIMILKQGNLIIFDRVKSCHIVTFCSAQSSLIKISEILASFKLVMLVRYKL